MFNVFISELVIVVISSWRITRIEMDRILRIDWCQECVVDLKGIVRRNIDQDFIICVLLE